METDDYKPPRVIEETPDYKILDWGDDGQGIHCMRCAWISYDEEAIALRYCPVCKWQGQPDIDITPLAPGVFILHGKKND